MAFTLRSLAFVLYSALYLSNFGCAQNAVPLNLIGILDSMSPPRNASDPRSGGTISVSGWSIVVPDNLLFGFPSAFVPYAEVVAAFPGFGGDYGNEVEIFANVVDGVPIAGLITISQLLFELSSGEIESLSFDGSIKLVNGPTIRINDPNGVYSRGYTEKPFFTADDESPSITAFSGFPMCVPRSEKDPLCPASNRVSGQTAFDAPDPLVMAPFQPGDYIEYVGIKVGEEIICYSIVANIMIFSTNPAYLRVVLVLIGVIDQGPNVEFSESRFRGYTSTEGVTLSVSAIDVDPCTGTESNRLLTQGIPVERNGGAVNQNKWEHRTDRLSIGEYTREYYITLTSGTQVTKNNITAGAYRSPVTVWVFPELNVIGARPTVSDFTAHPHLASGFGPDPEGWVYKQLSPWPGRFPIPAPAQICPDRVAPPAEIPASGEEQFPVVVQVNSAVRQKPGTLARFTAENATVGAGNTDLTYVWSQVNGTAAALVDPNTATPSLVVPLQTTAITTRWYLVNATHPSGSFSVGYVSLTADTSIRDAVVVDTYTAINSGGGTITVTAHTDLIGDIAATMTISVGGSGTRTPMIKVGTGTGRWQHTQRGVDEDAGIQLFSSGGGTASASAPAQLVGHPSETVSLSEGDTATATESASVSTQLVESAETNISS